MTFQRPLCAKNDDRVDVDGCGGAKIWPPPHEETVLQAEPPAPVAAASSSDNYSINFVALLTL